MKGGGGGGTLGGSSSLSMGISLLLLHGTSLVVGCQLCCVGIARPGEDPSLRVVPEVGLSGGVDNLPVGTSIFCLMLCVS